MCIVQFQGKKDIIFQNIQTFYPENEKFESNTQNNFITHEFFYWLWIPS